MAEAFLCDAARTPIGRYAGALAKVRTDDLAAVPIKALMRRNPQVDWAALDEVYLGCANQAGARNRLEAGRAQSVERDAPDRIRQARQEQRHAGDVAVVLAGLVGAAEIDLVERRPVDLGIAPHQRLDGHRREIVGTPFCERAGIAPDRGSACIAEERFGHEERLLRGLA